MTNLSAYRQVERNHIDELAEWISVSESRKREFADSFGSNDITGYLMQYSHRFAIAACVAQDMEHPDVERFWEDYVPFHDLEDMF